jgi:SAM-dependent methyltransferase/tetratricopeptide (TPR) repeat protein
MNQSMDGVLEEKKLPLQRCLDLIEGGERKAAKKLIKVAQRRDKQEPFTKFVLMGLGDLLRDNQQSSIRHFKKAESHAFGDALKYYYLAQAYVNAGFADKAVVLCDQAIALNESLSRVWNLRSMLAARQNDFRTAAQNMLKAVECDIDNGVYWQQLTQLASTGAQISIPIMRKLVLEALERKKIEFRVMTKLLFPLLGYSPETKKLKSLHDSGSLDQMFISGAALELMQDELLIAILNNTILHETEHEQWLAAMRKSLLTIVSQNTVPESLLEKAILCTSAMACYALSTEFVFYVSDEEGILLDQCKSQLVENDDNKQLALLLAILACYEILIDLPIAEPIARRLAGSVNNVGFQEMIKAHIFSRDLERSYYDKVKSFGDIDNSVSRNVRQQYEENPYPRWSNIGGDRSLPFKEFIRKSLPFLSEKKLPSIQSTAEQPFDVLIAGCGTGRHALMTVTEFQNVNVFAVDLSGASLSYALMKADEYAVDNVTFRQGDILNLPSLNKQFDIVESVGVLHHMDSPADGMAAIEQCLKPGGWMRIALYSELARKEVSLAREEIAKSACPATPEGIRGFRERVMTDPDGELFYLCANFRDFFSLSECRDLLFHVQEHQFTVPKIQQLIEPFNLEFMGFSMLPESVMAKKAEITDWQSLDQWWEFERAHPETFGNMYHFWLRKPL